MKLGLFMQPEHPPTRPLYECWERDLELLILADQIGYDEAWVGEHWTLVNHNLPAPDLLIAQAIRATRNLVLGTGVTGLPIHNPIDLAHRCAVLDHMSRGRFFWGVSLRFTPTDQSLFGLDNNEPEKVGERGLECLNIVLGIWTAEGGKFDYQGKYYEVHTPEFDAQKGRGLWMKPYQKPHPPIALASATPESSTTLITGKNGWMPLSLHLLRAPHLKTQWSKVEAGAASVGRRADRSKWRVARDIYVGETHQRAREEAREIIGKPHEAYNANRREMGLFKYCKLDPSMPDEAVTVDYLMENVWIVGDPDECAEKVQQLYDEVGGFGSLMAITHDPDDHSLEKRSLRRLKEEVMPRLKT